MAESSACLDNSTVNECGLIYVIHWDQAYLTCDCCRLYLIHVLITKDRQVSFSASLISHQMSSELQSGHMLSPLGAISHKEDISAEDFACFRIANASKHLGQDLSVQHYYHNFLHSIHPSQNKNGTESRPRSSEGIRYQG